jgi:exosome complex component CSL4
MNDIAICEIISVNNTNLRVTAKGIIAREDVKLTETDQLIMSSCFRPNDIIIAIVTNIGDRNQYSLSTADEQYGVRYAKSNASISGGGGGQLMVAVDYNNMKDPSNGKIEPRKVARMQE